MILMTSHDVSVSVDCLESSGAGPGRADGRTGRRHPPTDVVDPESDEEGTHHPDVDPLHGRGGVPRRPHRHHGGRPHPVLRLAVLPQEGVR